MGGAHYINMDQPIEFNHLVIDFLWQVDASAKQRVTADLLIEAPFVAGTGKALFVWLLGGTANL